jgi:hypothetical protein
MKAADWLWEFFGWLSLPVLGLLAGLIVKRKLHREFPFFLAYVLTASMVGAVRFVAYKEYSGKAYFYVFWCSDFVLLVAAFLALYETFLRRLFPAFSKVRVYRFLFPAAAVVIAFLAFLTALHSPDQRATFLTTSRIFDFLRSAVIGFFVILILLMGRQFSGYEFSIACGFGLQAAVALANSALKTQPRYQSALLDHFESIAYDVACLIWLITFWKPEKRTQFLSVDQLDSEMLHQARSWESVLKKWLTPGRVKR